jgi:hypothetical protein
MGLIHDIQSALLEDNSSLASILLKLKYLASKLGSAELADWVHHESDGYPIEADIPEYRLFDPQFFGHFSGAYGKEIKNAPIPPLLIEKFAGEHWTTHKCHQSIASIESLIGDNSKVGSFAIPTQNLSLMLDGKVYPGYTCQQVVAKISGAELSNVKSAVRSRILDLTLRLESEFPSATEIAIQSDNKPLAAKEADMVSKITNHIVYGNINTVNSSGDHNNNSINITQGDVNAVVDELSSQGISRSDAKDFAKLLQGEKPESNVEPFGPNTKSWIGKNISKAIDGTWQVGLSAATSLFTELALRYYGLK